MLLSKTYLQWFRWAVPPSSPQGSCTFPGADGPFHSAPCSVCRPQKITKNRLSLFCNCIRLKQTNKTVHFWFLCNFFPVWVFSLQRPLTCMLSSSLTRDQLLMKLWFSRAKMGELSRTVSRRVRPEPAETCSREEESERSEARHLKSKRWQWRQLTMTETKCCWNTEHSWN